MRRRSLLVTILLAPFARLLDLFKPKRRGFIVTSESVDFSKVASFDPTKPFTCSMWFKSKRLVNDRATKISEMGLLDGFTDNKWHHMVCDYDGTKSKPKVFINGLKPGEKLPPGAKVYL